MIRGVGLSELLPSINLRRDRSSMWLVGMSTEAEGNRAGMRRLKRTFVAWPGPDGFGRRRAPPLLCA